MSHGRPPRKPRYPAANNTLQLALGRAALLTGNEITDIMSPVRTAAVAMRTGRATRKQWELLAGQVDVATAIEDLGIVKGLRSFIAAADLALQHINARCYRAGHWRTPTLYANEITAITEFSTWHDWQVRQLSWAEYRAACDRAAGRITSAGCTVQRAADLAELSNI